MLRKQHYTDDTANLNKAHC